MIASANSHRFTDPDDNPPQTWTTPAIPQPPATQPNTRTPAQQEASRLNGAKSKGPRTAAGKTRSSRNAIKHGLLRRFAVGQIVDLKTAGLVDRLARQLACQYEVCDPVGEQRVVGLARDLLRADEARRLIDVEISGPVLPDKKVRRPKPVTALERQAKDLKALSAAVARGRRPGVGADRADAVVGVLLDFLDTYCRRDAQEHRRVLWDAIHWAERQRLIREAEARGQKVIDPEKGEEGEFIEPPTPSPTPEASPCAEDAPDVTPGEAGGHGVDEVSATAASSAAAGPEMEPLELPMYVADCEEVPADWDPPDALSDEEREAIVIGDYGLETIERSLAILADWDKLPRKLRSREALAAVLTAPRPVAARVKRWLEPLLGYALEEASGLSGQRHGDTQRYEAHVARCRSHLGPPDPDAVLKLQRYLREIEAQIDRAVAWLQAAAEQR